MIQVLSLLLIILVALVFSPVWSIPVILWHLFRFSAYELLFVAMCIDMYFGAHTWPYYTMGAIGGLLLLTWLRPHVAFLDTV